MRNSVLLGPILATSALSRSLSFLGQTPIGDSSRHGGNSFADVLDGPGDDVCPLPPKIAPPRDGLHASLDFIQDSAYRSKQVERLSRVVKVPSTSTELEDDPWSHYYDVFQDLHDELTDLFPLIHSYAKVEKVNRFGLAYTLNGTDKALKPILFMAHQDVVPIDDPNDWTYPPFSGHYDGQWLWGRGSSDCKNTLIGVLSAVEDLIKQGWTPTRTVVLSFGYDEESKGWKGAGSLAEHLEKRYGKDSFEFVIDEGGMGIQTIGDKIYAVPGVGEKGAVDLHISLSVNGGHSSIPPPHTGIGIISEIVYHLERDDLFTAKLDLAHPSRQGLTCQAKHSAEYVEPWLWSALESDDYTGLAEALAASRGDHVRFLYQTSQAADLINGGVKINALPEKINVTVNYRVAIHENTDMVRDRAIKIIKPIAKAHNLSMSAFGSGPKDHHNNHIDISDYDSPLEPAPVSPTSASDATWIRMSGVTRQFFESLPSSSGKTVLVVGDVMTGNTDTRFYWNLTRNIWRFSPIRPDGTKNIHTVDERIDMAVHLEAMAFYYELIRAFDTAEK